MRHFRFLAWTILLGGLAAVAAARSTKVERGTTVEIHGSVFDVDSKPIAGATVTVVRPGDLRRELVDPIRDFLMHCLPQRDRGPNSEDRS